MARPQGVYKDKNGSWYFKVRTHQDADGKWKQVTRRGFATATDAKLARQKVLDETEPLRDGSVRGLDTSTTVGRLVDRYLEVAEAMEQLGPKTVFDYRNYNESYIKPHLGHVLAHELQPAQIVEWQVTLSRSGAVKTGEGLSSNTIRLARAPLNGAYKFGIANGLVHRNPVADTRPPARVKKVPAHWTPEQAREFLAWQEGEWLHPFWTFMLATGVRIGEVVWLRWDDVSLDAKTVHVRRFATTLAYELRESSGKSREAVRVVQLDSHLVKVLNRQSEQQEATLGSRPENVFTDTSGRSFHPQAISKQLTRTSQELGLPRLSAHGLRHTSATLLLTAGVQPKVAAERLGHSDPSLFVDLYSHVTQTMQAEAALRIGELLSSAAKRADS
ncbi:MAG: site-specific integrase [Actinomycetota bacterium]